MFDYIGKKVSSWAKWFWSKLTSAYTYFFPSSKTATEPRSSIQPPILEDITPSSPNSNIYENIISNYRLSILTYNNLFQSVISSKKTDLQLYLNKLFEPFKTPEVKTPPTLLLKDKEREPEKTQKISQESETKKYNSPITDSWEMGRKRAEQATKPLNPGKDGCPRNRINPRKF